MDEITKNPIVMSILICALVYAYLYYRRSQKTDPLEKKKPVSVLIPAVSGLLAWLLLTSGLFGKQLQLKAQIAGNSVYAPKPAYVVHSDELTPFSPKNIVDKNMVGKNMGATSLGVFPKMKVPRPDVFAKISDFPF